MAMEKHTISHGGQDVVFELYRKNVKNVNLNVRPDMTIMVSANEKVPIDFIKNHVKKKVPWIFKKINYFRNAQPEKVAQKEYVSGESYKYLGKQYRLKVFEAGTEGVDYLLGYIHLYVKDKTDYYRKEMLLNKWFRERAISVFNYSLDKMYSSIEKYGVTKPAIKIKTMKARWGSCKKDKSIIILNYELIKAPKYCIDYVVLHELIHFLHRNHDERFHNFLTALMPDWKARKKILDEEVIRNL